MTNATNTTAHTNTTNATNTNTATLPQAIGQAPGVYQDQTLRTADNADYLHNVLHAQAYNAYVNDFKFITRNFQEEMWAAGYVNTPTQHRACLGYPIECGSW